jgi:hypothetical protein
MRQVIKNLHDVIGQQHDAGGHGNGLRGIVIASQIAQFVQKGIKIGCIIRISGCSRLDFLAVLAFVLAHKQGFQQIFDFIIGCAEGDDVQVADFIVADGPAQFRVMFGGHFQEHFAQRAVFINFHFCTSSENIHCNLG